MGGIRPLWLCAIWVMPDLTREVSTWQMLLCRCGQVSSSAELMARRRPKEGRWCVYYLRGLEEDTKEKKEVRECAWYMLDRSHLKTL